MTYALKYCDSRMGYFCNKVGIGVCTVIHIETRAADYPTIGITQYKHAFASGVPRSAGYTVYDLLAKGGEDYMRANDGWTINGLDWPSDL